ncbi:MAG TPA: hypothetical protein P5513_06645 [Candidatus Diapherotrites archaeon]|nr:hypothetical protein [Candidatus Diapherotrites archaeon]
MKYKEKKWRIKDFFTKRKINEDEEDKKELKNSDSSPYIVEIKDVTIKKINIKK